MVEETRQRKDATSLQAGPAEVDNNLYAFNIRVTQIIGQRLAQIGDELDYKWRQEPPIPWHPMNFGIYPFFLTRRAFSGVITNLWGSKIMPMFRMSRLLPQLQNGCQEARKWAAWVSSLQVSDCTRRTTYILTSALLLVTVSIFLVTWNEYEG